MNDYYLYDQLINRLLNSYDPVSKRDMADYLNVKVKTVKRLKDNINEFGIIIDEISGVNGGYYISDYSATFEPLVSLELCQLFRGSCATQFG